MSNINTMRAGRVLQIQINRPDKKNALTAEMYQAMADALRASDEDAGVRALLIHGGDAFTAGNDLEDFFKHPPQRSNSPVARFLEAISQAQKPIVAAVGGVAIGVGTTLLLHCDLVYADTTARFQLPFVNLGLVPEAASSYLLPLLAGHQRAAEMLLLGAPFDASKARECGIVNEVMAKEQLFETAMRAAQILAEKPAASVRLTKALMKRAAAKQIAEAMNAEAEHFYARLTSPEAKEAFGAFLEKRKPDFSKFD